MASSQKLIEEAPAKKASLPREPIEEMVSALTDPLIVFPSPWMDTLPDWIKRDLPIHRLTHQMKCLKGDASWEEATDLEAMAYLYPASLEHPLPYEWANIYLYLGTKVMGDRFPSDIKHETLTEDEMRELRQLKLWIQQRKVHHRKKRKTGEKLKEAIPDKYEQLSMI